MIVTTRILHPRGKNLLLNATWTQTVNGVTTPINLTGKTLEVFEVYPDTMATGWSADIVSPTAGTFTISRDWDATWPEGTGAYLPTFRVRSTDQTLAGALFVVELQ